MTYEQWESQVPAQIKNDTLWRISAYRLALFLSDLTFLDVQKMTHDSRSSDFADQLRRAASRISANISEGYSRNTGKGRSTYYEYALGSTRECRDWYYHARRDLDPKVLEHRLNICTDIVCLTSKMISNERRSNRKVSE